MTIVSELKILGSTERDGIDNVFGNHSFQTVWTLRVQRG